MTRRSMLQKIALALFAVPCLPSLAIAQEKVKYARRKGWVTIYCRRKEFWEMSPMDLGAGCPTVWHSQKTVDASDYFDGKHAHEDLLPDENYVIWDDER